MKKKTVILFLASFSMLVGLFIAYLSLYAHAVRKVALPSQIETLAQFKIAMDDATITYWEFEKNGQTYLEARKMMPLWTLPSGSVCYVFDENGQFKDWVLDNGESSAWNEKWGQTERRKSESND